MIENPKVRKCDGIVKGERNKPSGTKEQKIKEPKKTALNLLLSRHWDGSICGVHNGHPHAEPPYLQPEEQTDK